MWTEAHRARHDARLKEIVSLNAVGQVACWLERADPPRSGRATPDGAVVLAGRWVGGRSFGWLVHWGELLRDRAGRLHASAARIAFATALSGVKALLNPMQTQAAAR